MVKVALVGSGAITASVLELMKNKTCIQLMALITTPRSLDKAQELLDQYAPDIKATTDIPTSGIDVVVEMAGHTAIREHVLPAVKRGIRVVIASVGALTDDALRAELTEAQKEGGNQIELIPGAIGAIDALAAAKIGGLSQVSYFGRKAPIAWKGTAAESIVNLDQLTEPFVFFEGTARQAAQQFPKNANVAATVALAGIGLDHTKVQLIADPVHTENEHRLVVEGVFGQFELRMQNAPLPTNPKTSAQTAYSLVRSITNLAKPWVL